MLSFLSLSLLTFNTTNSALFLGTNNGYWLQDYNENAPALSVLENVKTFLDPTNSEALDWYQNLLSGSMAKLKAAGAVISTDTVSKLPNEFKSKTEIGYPYQVIEKFSTEVLAMLETNNSSSNFTLLTSVPESKTGNACIVLDNLQFTWEGLNSLMPQIQSLAIRGQKCFLPPAIDFSSKSPGVGTELFKR